MAKFDFSKLDLSDVNFDTEVIDGKKWKVLSFKDLEDRDVNFNDYETDEEKTLNSNDGQLQNLQKQSEDDYIKIANSIVRTSSVQLKSQNRNKKLLKKIFTIFFIAFISVQYFALLGIFVGQMIFGLKPPSDTVVVAYISSVFAETLGAIVLMIKYAFDSEQETQVLAILNGVISNYQKFNGRNPELNKTSKTKK